MDFNILLGLSVIVCLVGLFLRLSIWFTQGIEVASQPISPGERIKSAMTGLTTTVAGAKIVEVFRSIILDLFFQKRIFDKSFTRWLAHSLIFFGFIPLLFMHALSPILADSLFSDYQPTLTPFLFLRDFFGLMVLIGVGLAVFRRINLRDKRLKTYLSDWAALVFLAIIMLSGMMLLGGKMTSYSSFQAMTEEYGGFDEEEQLALEAYWVVENGLESPNILQPPSEELVAQGQEVHEMNCMDCHSSNRMAFISFPLRNISQAFHGIFGDPGGVNVLLTLHLFACFGFLAWLPFSKMFHILAAPINLIIKRVTGDELGEPANILNRQMIGLSACTHCGSCSVECSSSMFSESFNNDFILPSEKVQFLKRFAANQEKDTEIIKKMQEGLYVCTSCDRCTTICPSGINLKDLFVRSRYNLLAYGEPEATMLSHFSFPLALAQNFVDDHLKALKKVTDLFKKNLRQLADIGVPISLDRGEEPFDNTTFKGCYSCQRCTNICPVVRSFDNPGEKLGLLPHQIMFSLGIGNVELAMGSQMIWSCSTCYLCQEHCPNQVELCDIFYRLKNGVINKLEAGGANS